MDTKLGITEEQIIATNGDLFAQFQLAADGLNKLEGGVEKTAIAYKNMKILYWH